MITDSERVELGCDTKIIFKLASSYIKQSPNFLFSSCFEQSGVDYNSSTNYHRICRIITLISIYHPLRTPQGIPIQRLQTLILQIRKVVTYLNHGTAAMHSPLSPLIPRTTRTAVVCTYLNPNTQGAGLAAR